MHETPITYWSQGRFHFQIGYLIVSSRLSGELTFSILICIQKVKARFSSTAKNQVNQFSLKFKTSYRFIYRLRTYPCNAPSPTRYTYTMMVLPGFELSICVVVGYNRNPTIQLYRYATSYIVFTPPSALRHIRYYRLPVLCFLGHTLFRLYAKISALIGVRGSCGGAQITTQFEAPRNSIATRTTYEPHLSPQPVTYRTVVHASRTC